MIAGHPVYARMYMHATLTRVLLDVHARAQDRSRSRYAIIIIAANNGPVIGALHAFLMLLFGSFASFGQVTPFASSFFSPYVLFSLFSLSFTRARNGNSLRMRLHAFPMAICDFEIPKRCTEKGWHVGKSRISKMNGERFTRTRSDVCDISRPVFSFSIWSIDGKCILHGSEKFEWAPRKSAAKVPLSVNDDLIISCMLQWVIFISMSTILAVIVKLTCVLS